MTLRKVALLLAALLVPLSAFAQSVPPVPTAPVVLAPVPAPRITQNFTSTGAYRYFDSRKNDPRNRTWLNGVIHSDRYAFTFGPSYKTPQGVWYCGAGYDVVIENVKADLRKPTGGGDLPGAVGVSDGTCAPRQVTVIGGEFWNFKMTPVAGKYTQGDGIDCDNRAVLLVVRDLYTHDNSDGGIDTKCTTTLNNIRSERNYRNYRLWGKFTIGAIASLDPRNAHVWLSQGADGTIDKLVASGSTARPVFYFDKTSLHPIEVKECVFNFSVPTKLLGGVTKGNMLKLGKGCVADAQGYAINTPVTPPVPAGVCTFPAALNDNNRDGIIDLGAVNRAKCGGVARVKLVGRNAAGGYVYDKLTP